MLPVLETPRLVLQPLTLADAPRTQQLFAHWEIVRHLAAGVPWPYPADGAESFYRDHALPAIARGEEWHWTLRLKSAPAEHIGSIALHGGHENNRGFWIGLPWQRRGLVLEGIYAVNDFWFDTLGQPLLRIPKAVANTGSRRLSEKTGMRLAGTLTKHFAEGPLPAEIWEQTAAEWRAFRAAHPLPNAPRG